MQEFLDGLSVARGETGRSDGSLRMLLGGLRDRGVFVLSRVGRVLSWSASAEAVYGYAADEITGQLFGVLFTAEDAAAGKPARQLEAAHRGGFEGEGWLLRRDGSRFWASQVLAPLHDRQGRLRGFGAVTRVLTDRMRGEDLRAVLDAATDAVLGVDADGAIMFVNRSAATMFGYARHDLLGRQVEELVPQRARAWHPARRREHAQKPVPRAMGGGLELSGVRRDGSEFPAEVSLSEVQTPRGPVVTALVRDLTEQRRADAERRLAEERRAAVFDQSPAGQLEASLDARLIRVNTTLERMLDYPSGGLDGRTWRDLVHAEDSLRLVPAVAAVARGEVPAFHGDLRLVTRAGDPVPALVAASALRDGNGDPQRVLAVAIDRRRPGPDGERR